MNKILLYSLLGAITMGIPHHAQGADRHTSHYQSTEPHRFNFFPHIIKGTFNSGLSLWLTLQLRNKYKEFQEGKLTDNQIYFYSILGIPAWIITSYLSVHHSALVMGEIERRMSEKPVREVVKDLGKDIAKETIKDTAKDIKESVTSPFTSKSNAC